MRIFHYTSILLYIVNPNRDLAFHSSGGTTHIYGSEHILRYCSFSMVSFNSCIMMKDRKRTKIARASNNVLTWDLVVIIFFTKFFIAVFLYLGELLEL